MTDTTIPAAASFQVGDEIPELSTPPISRLTLALYAGASGDHNPIHVDLDFARYHGMDDVFAHGMLATAYLGRMLTNWIPQSAIRSFGVRFVAISQVHDELSCRGVIRRKYQDNQETLVDLELTVSNQQGEAKVVGEATIALPAD
ncbi:MaoC family dehydratase [uncultured Marinobacter sp.]|uniref:MaoC family dehydratase n=1 Tax=uncultured Marinobacter sp. TaxID=187379 RepID=UPI0030DA7D91